MNITDEMRNAHVAAFNATWLKNGAGISDGLSAALEAVHPLIRKQALEGAMGVFRLCDKFRLGDRVTKVSGAHWTGRIVGFYSTDLTPVGYAFESETERGSVQIYPEAALRSAVKEDGE